MSARRSALPVRNALDLGERPDPALGIFETVLFADGRAPLLEAQLERLASSARELYGPGAVPDADAARRPLPPGVGRLRVSFVPGATTTVEAGPIGPDPLYTEVAPFVLPGGLGKHKWIDRRMLDAITAAAGPHALPLLIDDDGSVLESTRTNVLIEDAGRLVTPPADGRIRAGFGRTRLVYSEERFDLDRLLAADAVVLTSALRVVRLVE